MGGRLFSTNIQVYQIVYIDTSIFVSYFVLILICFRSLMSRQYWRLMPKQTTDNGLSSTWMLLTYASPPSLPLPLRARLRMTAWMSMSGDQVRNLLWRRLKKLLTVDRISSVGSMFDFFFLMKNITCSKILLEKKVTIKSKSSISRKANDVMKNLYWIHLLNLKGKIEKKTTYLNAKT